MIPDADVDPKQVTRLVLCTGKVYYDITGAEQRAAAEHVAVARVEQLYPFPSIALGELVASLPALEEVVWTQEEPRNMGAWPFIEPRLVEVLGDRATLEYAGRPERSSPAEGFSDVHERQQAAIVEAALGASSASAPKKSPAKKNRAGK